LQLFSTTFDNNGKKSPRLIPGVTEHSDDYCFDLIPVGREKYKKYKKE